MTWQMVLFEKEQLQVTAFSEPTMPHPYCPLHGSTLKFQFVFPNVCPISLRACTVPYIERKLVNISLTKLPLGRSSLFERTKHKNSFDWPSDAGKAAAAEAKGAARQNRKNNISTVGMMSRRSREKNISASLSLSLSARRWTMSAAEEQLCPEPSITAGCAFVRQLLDTWKVAWDSRIRLVGYHGRICIPIKRSHLMNQSVTLHVMWCNGFNY